MKIIPIALKQRKGAFWLTVFLLLILQGAMALTIVHRESLTFDEGDHMFAGYMMWKARDFGLNPEHPPLVKLLATIPVLGKPLWVPPLRHRFFKEEAYMDGRDWLARNDGSSQRLVFRMRASAELLALGLSLIVFLATRAWFGDLAGLIALVLVVFDPNVLANSALVTTDIGVSCFFVASIFTFYRYTTRPTLARLCVAGVTAGLLLAAKHSGILLAPMLLLLIICEVFVSDRIDRRRVACRLAGAFFGITVIAVLVLWSFYGFRYSARPAGLTLSTSLTSYVRPLSHFQSSVILAVGRLHLLPEAYLIGLVDVKRMAVKYPTFLLGTVYAHGVLSYFPLVILIKTTLGLLALAALAFFAASTRRIAGRRQMVYVLIPPAVYLAIAMAAGMDIGSRHLLTMYAFLIIFAAVGASALARTSRTWAVICAALVGAHVLSTLLVFPNELAYANEAWGGPKNVHNLLSDANVDWAQQLYQVKEWQDRHPSEECWFAYFARPEIDPATYGIRCHALPTDDTQWLGGEDLIPPVVTGAILISAGDLSGCEWPSGRLNPYRFFQRIHPTETIDDSVFVYHGRFTMSEASAVASAQLSEALLRKHQPSEALVLAGQAVVVAPDNLFAQIALGDAASGAGNTKKAVIAWQTAIKTAEQLEPDAQASYLPTLEAKVKRLGDPR